MLHMHQRNLSIATQESLNHLDKQILLLINEVFVWKN